MASFDDGTPDDPDQVTAELAENGAQISSDTEDGPQERRWSDLSKRGRGLIIAGGAAAAGLLMAAVVDLKRRPASQIRGPKPIWTLAVLLQQPFGPLSYFAFGRRRQPDPGCTDARGTARRHRHGRPVTAEPAGQGMIWKVWATGWPCGRSARTICRSWRS